MVQKAIGKDTVKKEIELLEKSYPDAKYYLDFKTQADLIVAVILSAQTHDEIVNAVTPALFRKYKTAKDYAHADPDELIGMIKRVSFAGNKAKNIIAACKVIEEKHNGKLPKTMDELVELPGIGRKSANTILINAYGIVEGIPVDTHVIRVSYRIGATASKDPEQIEQDLMAVVEKKYWHNLAYVIKAHGRAICKAPTPECGKCMLNKLCPKNGVTKQL